MSTLLIGSHVPPSVIGKWIKNHVYITYLDREGESLTIDRNWIAGYFRTAGNLAIGIAVLMGAKNIYIVGMDGFTYYKEEQIEYAKKNQHCYGKGHTDDYGWQESIEKDEQIYNALKLLNKSIDFKILTPTIYSNFYNGNIL